MLSNWVVDPEKPKTHHSQEVRKGALFLVQHSGFWNTAQAVSHAVCETRDGWRLVAEVLCFGLPPLFILEIQLNNLPEQQYLYLNTGISLTADIKEIADKYLKDHLPWVSESERTDFFKQMCTDFIGRLANHYAGGWELIEKTDVLSEEKRSQQMTTFEYDVFICHSSKDKPIIDNIVKDFKRERITYWLDAEQINFGEPITEKIEDGLQKSKYIMPCLSVNLARSGWTRAEYGSILNAELSGKSERIVIPLKLDNCSESDIPLLLRDKKRVTFSNKMEFGEFLNFLKSVSLKSFS